MVSPVQLKFSRLSASTCIVLLMVLLAAVVSTPIARAAAASSSADAADLNSHEELQLTLNDAINYAFSYDLDHEIARVEWENARIDNLIAEAGGPVSAYERLQRQLEERRAEHGYVTARRSLVLGVVDNYLELKQAEREVEITRRQLEIARQELAIVQEMVRIGERHPQDELREKNRVAAAELAANAAARTYDSHRSALLHRLGLPDDVRLVLVEEPEPVPFTWSLEETIAYAREHNFSVWERDMSVRIAAMDLDALRVQDPARLQLEKAENNFRLAELIALQGERNFHISVVAAFYALNDAAQRYEAAVIDDELAASAYDIARRQYEAGLSTALDWERAQLEHLTATKSYHDSVYAYVRSRLELLDLIGHPLDPYEESAAR